jgi:acyl-CoA dehydrogenase
MDKAIEAIATRLFNDHSDSPATTTGTPSKLWAALEESELTRAWLSMHDAGLTLTDVFGLIRLSGTTLYAVPYADTLFASYLLSSAELDTPRGAISVALPASGDDSEYLEVPFGTTVDYVVVVTNEDTLVLANAGKQTPVANVGSDPVALVATKDLDVIQTTQLPATLSGEHRRRVGALIRTTQMCGAMDTVLELTLQHTSNREQFGRPLTKFQAVQHLLADMAGEASASSAMADAAIASFAYNGTPDLRQTASAKARASEAAGIVAANAHQAHGAIGYTAEYALSTYTRRLWRWREEYGDENQWALALAKDYLSPDAGTLTEAFFDEH